MELGWIDFSEGARKKVLDVLDTLREAGAVDEIGIGIVRDAFSAKLFPGTSVLHTRAKYLFLVSYALKDMERADNSNKAASALRREYDRIEENVARRLIKGVDEALGQGIIGARSLHADLSGSWVKLGPAMMYWNALSRLGFFRRGDMSMGAYFALLAGRKPMEYDEASSDDIAEGWNNDKVAKHSLWNVPAEDYAHWHERDGIGLTNGEARFLANQIRLNCAGSLYQELVDNAKLRDALLGLYGYGSPNIDDENAEPHANPFGDFIGQAAGDLSPELLELCTHAVDFSNFVYLCRIRYNAQLTSMREEANERWDEFGDFANAYASALDIDWFYAHLGLWERSGSSPLYRFLREARDYMLEGNIAGLDECIRRREQRIKRSRAKIGNDDNDVGAWRGGTWLDYRCRVAARMIADMREAGGFDV